jgi:3-deoxy-manno-octulosonate cytidylyltransferase (CMP-KDO synthetase)
MEVMGVIPARFASSRFAGKILTDLLGKPLIQYVWERAKEAFLLNDLIIACDDERVKQACEGFGAKVTMTSRAHTCGTDRIAEVINPLDARIVINIQADEPLIHPTMIDSLAQCLLDDSSISMATLMKEINNSAEINDSNVVKVVVDKDNFALYFSRAPIPYRREGEGIYYKHLGLYAYTKDFLFVYKNLPVSRLEKQEKLEQLRVLEAGFRIKMIETKYETIGVDTPQDLEKVKEYLKTNNQ